MVDICFQKKSETTLLNFSVFQINSPLGVFGCTGMLRTEVQLGFKKNFKGFSKEFTVVVQKLNQQYKFLPSKLSVIFF